ncbi:BRISC and BRCA1-A complex member 2-like isoform X2 [Chenopodium quinoa]|uniref:BRISC and BRCA1-A complex member 2-like isoform X2 n=1 Tax=Chenopodium quinoa TaxID=63459 RepID=UPI000B79A9F7|nr:BRISC and BRCA1-A complex member 2-like isoform X2 [Chenopodium quinoa]
MYILYNYYRVNYPATFAVSKVPKTQTTTQLKKKKKNLVWHQFDDSSLSTNFRQQSFSQSTTMAVDGVPPIIAAQLNHLLSHSPFSIKVDQMWSGSKKNVWNDRFTLLIPFCLDFIKWDIIYNVESPLAPPDVIFGAEDDKFLPFVLSSDPSKSPMHNLSNWNSKDPSRLLSLILQLRELYSAYQWKRVGGVDDDRVKFEISTMLSREGIEMSLSSGVEKPEEVKFAVPLLDTSINNMVPACPWRQQQKIYLQVIYPIGRKYQSAPSAPRLKLISTLELKSLFSVEDIKLPTWLNGMCMAEYLPALEETLQMQILEAVSLIGVRRHFIETLSTFFGRPLEADPIFCREATFLVANGVFTFLVHIFLPIHFPKQKPTLILQSSQHFNTQGVPVRSPVMSEYPWSPRWELSEMASRIL